MGKLVTLVGLILLSYSSVRASDGEYSVYQNFSGVTKRS